MAANGQHNIANCSWGDHLVFGEGDGLLRTVLLTPYITNCASRGRAFPPCTDGSAHHFSDRRRTAM